MRGRNLLLAACAASGCASSSGDDRFARHAQLSVWEDGLLSQLDEPSRYGPEAALLIATPLLHQHDREIQENAARNHPVTGGDPARGEAVDVALGAVALGFGGWEWIDGDRGRSLEVGLESVLLTEGITEIVKKTAHRSRPEGGSKESLPSSHASTAFAFATFLARNVERADEGEPSAWWRELGWLAYLPATYVAISRVEANRHFASDVAAGAFIGVLTTNWVFDAHYGDVVRGRRGIFETDLATRKRATSWIFAPFFDGQQVGLVVARSF